MEVAGLRFRRRQESPPLTKAKPYDEAQSLDFYEPSHTSVSPRNRMIDLSWVGVLAGTLQLLLVILIRLSSAL